MKLVYLWVENHKDIIKNQSFSISSAYDISYDVEQNKLHIIKNEDYIENFYGKNILDVTAITRWINESKEFVNKKVQLIVATHSPIILSDIPQKNIIYLNKPFDVIHGENPTFGAGIGTLFYDSFFMKKGSIGEIARKEIQWVIDNIENSDLNIIERKRLVYIIDNMGDKFLREKLKSYPVYIETTAGSGELNGKD